MAELEDSSLRSLQDPFFGVRTALIAGEANSEAFKPAQIFFSSFSFFYCSVGSALQMVMCKIACRFPA